VQFLNKEFERAIREKLKLGVHDKPVCRVEVDRLAFIPGRTEQLSFITGSVQEVKSIERRWIENGETVANPQDIAFPLVGYGLDDVSSHYRTEERPNHRGIDIACPMETPVVAAWAGTVIHVDDGPKAVQKPAGIQIQIQHANGVVTKYFHLRRVMVQVGQSVQQGQIIGLSGNSGHVMSQGKEITGSYDDPNSLRAKGYGAHLHFEIWIDGKDVNPYPYLSGARKMYNDSTNVGQVVDEGSVNVVKGALIHTEPFDYSTWYQNSHYKVDPGLPYVTRIDKTTVPSDPALRFDFTPSDDTQGGSMWGFDVNFTFSTPVALITDFSTNMNGNGEFRIKVDGRTLVRFTKGQGVGKIISTGDKYIPGKGSTTIRFEVYWNGSSPMSFLLHCFKIAEITEVSEFSNITAGLDKSTGLGYWVEEEVSDLILNTRRETVDIQVGSFVYMDTLTLDNVVSISINENFEQEASEATIVLSNPNGFYSPDYNPALFPENYMETPFSYQINGATIGVLSENTPIRIYLGYGLNMMRVFTGLIDKVDINSNDSTITITCRNMYKRIMEKVLTEDLSYPRDLGHENIVDVSPKAVDYEQLDRTQKIVYKAQQYGQQFGVDYKLILAIAWAETQMGTTGAGREESGSYICGYGVYGPNNKKEWAAGIDRQCYYVAKRIREALGDRPITRDAIAYLQKGGDKGTAYRYNSDPNWVDNVWNAYSKLVPNNPVYTTKYFTTTGGGVTPSLEDYTEKSKITKLWLKSAIIHDLVDKAGLVGWRVTSEDLAYPDVVIEESYLIEANQATGKVIVAVPDKEGEFVEKDIESIPTVHGWLNPFVQPPTKFESYKYKINDCIRELIQDTNYRSYCDRYGTYRLEKIRYTGNCVAYFTENENLVTVGKSIDFSRGRSHLVIFDDQGKYENFVDPEILAELKGEVRTAVVNVPWARTKKQKADVARRMFWDMKRLCRTMQVAIPGNPALDILDLIYIYSPNTATRGYFTIKGIRTNYSIDGGYTQILDLTWINSGAVIG